jgi:hypothetical protein
MRISAVRNILLLFTAFVLPTALLGQNLNPRVSLFASSSVLKGDRDFVVDGDQFRSQFITGGRIGVRGTIDLTNHWSIETTYLFGTNNLQVTQLSTTGQVRDFGVRQHQLTANLLHFFNGSRNRVRFFVDGGLGLSRFSPTDAAIAAASVKFIDESAVISSDNKFNFNYGGGVESRFTNRLGMRLYVRDHMVGMPRFGVPETPQGTGSDFFPVNGLTHNIEMSVGTVFYLASPR